MRFAEVVVNVPIRRTFARRYETAPEPPPVDEFDTAPGSESGAADAGRLQTFHYGIPPELENVLKPGHLIWAPFGPREIQGVVVGMAESAPVATRPIARLARPEPVMLPTQIELARWIADYYVAPISEAVKLFLPPGLLAKDGDSSAVRAKRELQIALLVKGADAEKRLETLARDTPRIRVLTWFLDHPGQTFSPQDLMAECSLKSSSAIQTLRAKQIVGEGDGGDAEGEDGGKVALLLSPAEAASMVDDLRGLERYRRVIDALASAGRPLWRSELYQQVDADSNLLRALQQVGLISLDEQIRFRDPLAGRIFAPTDAPSLTSEQSAVWERIYMTAFQPDSAAEDLPVVEQPADDKARIFSRQFLLHGVTGSGKTEIYLRAIAETIKRGKQAIVLVPEIALTPQTVARFAARFPHRVTVIHSGLSTGERYDVWRHLRDDKFDVVVGPRSALFAPLSRLGLIVIDEEHESSYKQNAEEWGSFTVFYDARTVARRLAESAAIPLILGSATPSLDTYFAAEHGQIQLMEMSSRVLGHQADRTSDLHALADQQASEKKISPVASYTEMPPVEIVDMRQELRAGNRSIFSRSLQSELHATLDAGEQAILFMNRRGAATFVLCRDCGHVQECERCEIPLTQHERAQVLICHHCNRRYPIPEICPQCNSKRIKYFGSGTQRIEEFVQQIAPRARVIRWDADTAAGKGKHEEILNEFADHRADVLIGTQMIAKGLDLPKVTLVGVIAADVGLFLPDFRSSERTFQLLTQVAGRAGRSHHGGRVVVQTYSPDHYAIQAAAQHDYVAFYNREMQFRQEHNYPPVRRLARLI